MDDSRIRIWLGWAAVGAIAVGAVVAAILVRSSQRDDFEGTQRGEVVRAAHQVQSDVAVSLGQLASASAFYEARGCRARTRGMSS